MKNEFLILVFLLSILSLIGCNNNSGGISREEDSKLTPLHPSQVTAEISQGNVLLKWLGTGEDVLKHYSIYRKSSDDTWNFIAKVNPENENRGKYTYYDKKVKMGITYIYGIVAINNYGNQSKISESNSITLK